jgi:hypothetical protein
VRLSAPEALIPSGISMPHPRTAIFKNATEGKTG